MPELASQTHLRVEEGRKASIAYSYKSLIDNSPGGELYAKTWSQQFPPQVSKPMRFWEKSAVNLSLEVDTWPVNRDPFTQKNLLENEESQVQELVLLQIRMSPVIRHRESLANRLITLFNDAKGEDCTSVGIAIGSLRNFLNFFQLNTNLKCPTISLTPENNIYASWRAKHNRLFSVHFLPSGDIRFVIFKPNDRHPELQIRLSGTATTDMLKETVVPHGVWDWISE
jgi:hypothetical protein